jgi:[acyl-carrier-protein] S-malonyltransferase
VVISGHAEAVQRASDLALSRGAKKATRLSVSAPFHCSLMRPAADRFRERIEAVSFREMRVPLISNVTAKAIRDPNEVRELLASQIFSPVRWMECVQEARRSGIESTMELGGDVLSNLIKRIDPRMQTISISTLKHMPS